MNVLARANLGRTTYEVREDGTNLVIVRNNVDGEKTFHVPRALFDEYAAEAAGRALAVLIRGGGRG